MQGEGDVGPGGAEGCQFPRPHRPHPPWDGCHLPLSQATPCFPRGWGGDPASPMALGGVDLGPSRAWKVYYPHISPAKFITAISVQSLCGGDLTSEL